MVIILASLSMEIIIIHHVPACSQVFYKTTDYQSIINIASKYFRIYRVHTCSALRLLGRFFDIISYFVSEEMMSVCNQQMASLVHIFTKLDYGTYTNCTLTCLSFYSSTFKSQLGFFCMYAKAIQKCLSFRHMLMLLIIMIYMYYRKQNKETVL